MSNFDVSKTSAEERYSLNFSYFFDYTPDFRIAAKRYIVYKQKSLQISEFCKKKGIRYQNAKMDQEKHFAMARRLSEVYPGLYINAFEDLVCDLSMPIEVSRQDREYFNYFFHLRLSNLSITDVDDFLNYHLLTSFNNELGDFSRFLSLLLREYDKYTERKFLDTVLEWKELAFYEREKSNEKTPRENNNKTNKLKWKGSPENLMKGFKYLQKSGYCTIENMNNFIHSNFVFEFFQPPRYEENNYKFCWEADKHDFTCLLRSLKTKKIVSTNSEIRNFILRHIPHSSDESIMTYLKGVREKKKYSIQIDAFC